MTAVFEQNLGKVDCPVGLRAEGGECVVCCGNDGATRTEAEQRREGGLQIKLIDGGRNLHI